MSRIPTIVLSRLALQRSKTDIDDSGQDKIILLRCSKRLDELTDLLRQSLRYLENEQSMARFFDGLKVKRCHIDDLVDSVKKELEQ